MREVYCRGWGRQTLNVTQRTERQSRAWEKPTMHGVADASAVQIKIGAGADKGQADARKRDET
jgi:hypothetical protein